MPTNFAECRTEFLSHANDIYSNFVYRGPTDSAFASPDKPASITLNGCKQLCGLGTEYYSWRDASNTITTWVLPIIGLLLQAPYESNKAWDTILLLTRWVGNPMSSLSYLLWNIKVAGKCALMVDMSTRYDEFPGEDSEFSFMRDSLFILSVMNQYSIKTELPPIEAEMLLRIALFSNILQLPNADVGEKDLLTTRTRLARDMREGRKKGVVPVFVSFLWYVFALVLTIQLAFGELGDNQTAHNLGIGFLSGWLPIMVLASAVDRNVVSADAVQDKLNKLMIDVRLALLDHDTRLTYMQITHTGPELFAWCKALEDEQIFDGNFFTGFAGQGRMHWHYGVAHPILAGMESKFMASYGRDWLSEGYAARLAMVASSRNVNGLKMFDARMVWQVISSLFIVGGSVGGAFVISYFTPTVGLGCRSGSFFVYLVVSFGLLVIELVVWYLTNETPFKTPVDVKTRLRHALQHFHLEKKHGVPLRKRVISSVKKWWSLLSSREAMKNLVLRPGELFNSIWLVYLTIAQTVGAFNRCDCMASVWLGGGGFIDFDLFEEYRSRGVAYYWGTATGVSLTVLTGGLCYIAFEYCTQGHLNTEHYGRAMQGLKATRRCKRYTMFIRTIPDKVIKAIKLLLHKTGLSHTSSGRRSLVWTAKTESHTDFFNKLELEMTRTETEGWAKTETEG